MKSGNQNIDDAPPYNLHIQLKYALRLKHNNKVYIQTLDRSLTSKNESCMNAQYEPWLTQFLLAFFPKNYIYQNQQWAEFGKTCFGEIHPIMFATSP